MTEAEIDEALNNLLSLNVSHERVEALFSIAQTNMALAERLIKSRLIAAQKANAKHVETDSQTQISDQISDAKSGEVHVSSDTVCYVASGENSAHQQIASSNTEKSLVRPITNQPKSQVDNSDDSTGIMAEVAGVARPAANGQQPTTTSATTTSKTSTTTPAKPASPTTTPEPPLSSSVSTDQKPIASEKAKPISTTGHSDQGHSDQAHSYLGHTDLGTATDDGHTDLLGSLAQQLLATLDGQNTAATATQPQPIPKPPARYPRLSAQTMADPKTLALCYSKALSLGHCTAADRYRFFVLAANIARRSENGDIHSPGGCFLSCVRGKRWFQSEADEDAATTILDSLGWRDSDA